MKIKSLKLTDFKGFEKLHIESFGKQTTAIIGNNGAGKSSVIEAIRIMFLELDPLKVLDFDEPDIFNLLINNESKTQIAQVSIEIENKFKPIKPLLLRDKTHFYYEDSFVFTEFRRGLKKILTDKGNFPLIILYPTTRTTNNSSFRVNNQNADSYQTDLSWRESLQSSIDFNHFLNWFKEKEAEENEKRLYEDGQIRLKELEALRKAYIIFFPDFKLLRIKRSEQTQLILENGNKILSFNQLSDGEQGVIALIGDIVRRLSEANPKLEDPLQGEAIIMIDEIELHLHPTWQRKIIKKLEAIFPNCQFIITTHSPQVLSELDAENDKIIAIKDFKAYEIPTVFGRETNWILETVMDTPARPSEFKNQLREYFDLIANDKLDEAEILRKELEAQTGSDEPEFVKADMLIRRKKAMKK